MADDVQELDNQTQDKAAAPAQTDKTATTTVADKTTGAKATDTTVATDKTLAAGGKTEDVKPVWPDDWRDRMAATVGGTDPKAVVKERKRLDRFTDPSAVYGTARELEAKFSEGGLVKIPGPKATDEEKASFAKAMGVPEKPEDYLTKLNLPQGKVLGDNDKPLAEAFAKAMHPVGLTPTQMSAAVAWRLDEVEKEAAAQYDADQTYRHESEQQLKEELGPSFAPSIRAIATLFAGAPGGANPDDETSLMARVLGGRTADGKIIGDDPAITRFFANLALEVNPAATIIPSGSGESAKGRLEEIRALRKSDPDKYNADKAMQAEELKLIDVELKMKNRGSKAA